MTTNVFIGSGSATSTPGGVTTFAEISLQIIKQVLDTMQGTATGGATTYLTDTTNLTQPDGYWDKGTIWIQSGTNAGKALKITTHAANKANFAAQAVAIAAGARYTVARGAYPLDQIYGAVNTALDETYVDETDITLEGDSETQEFTLPAGVYNVKHVHFQRDGVIISRCNHWRERNGKLIFDYGHTPYDGDVIVVTYRTKHAEISATSDTINAEINREWLALTAARELLYWGASKYGKEREYMIEERLNKVIAALKGKQPRIEGTYVTMKTAGG